MAGLGWLVKQRAGGSRVGSISLVSVSPNDCHQVGRLGGAPMDESWSDDFEVLHWVVERFERNVPSVEVGEALRVFPEEQYDSVRESLRRLSTHSYLVRVSGGGSARSTTAGPRVGNTSPSARCTPSAWNGTMPSFWPTGFWRCLRRAQRTSRIRKDVLSSKPGLTASVE